MSNQPHQGAELLPVMAAAFPNAFFTEARQVRPLKLNIHFDLLAALPNGIEPYHVKRFLGWYVNRPVYLKALAHGTERIDLTGAMVGEISDEVRQQAKQKLEAIRPLPAAGAPRSGATATPGPASAPASPLNLEELYAMAVDAKLEVTLKFSTLPQAKPAGAGKMAFALRTPDGQFVTAEVGNKVWAKFTKATEAWPAWMAALTGAMGERTDQGFRLANPGLQVFERKPKAAPDAPAPTATAPPPASPPPAEPVAPPPPAAPVTVTTGAGTATVTKRNPLSLKRNASAEADD